jgi:prefoldin subunit 5
MNLKGVMAVSEVEVAVGVLKERVDNMEKTQDGLCKKLDMFQNTLMVTLGGVIVNLIVLLLKK